MSRIVVIFALFAVLCTPAHGLRFYDASRLSCERVKSILKKEGLAILQFNSARNPSNRLYDHFSANSNRCKTGGRGKLFTIQTANGKACRIHRCVKVYSGNDRD